MNCPRSIIPKHPARLAAGISKAIEHQGVQVAVAVEVPQADPAQGDQGVGHLPACGKATLTIVEPNHIVLAPVFAEIVHVAIPIQVAPGEGVFIQRKAAVAE